MNILLFGKTGQVGSGLEHQLRSVGRVLALSRNQLDLADLSAVERILLEHRPDIIVNAAAYTAVDKAETDVKIAELVNADAPGIMAETARRIGALLIHYSTDYVFPGDADRPYKEDDPTGPRNHYGLTKLKGEQAIAALADRYLIFRTSWVYSYRGRNFFNTILQLAEERDELRIVDDQYGTPTYAELIAEATAEVLSKVVENADASYTGTYHMTCSDVTSWKTFAQAILERAGKDSVQVIPIPTSQYPTPAQRPKYSALDNSKITSTLGVRLPHWGVALDKCFADSGLADQR